MSNHWALTEHITRHLVRPRLGDIRPPALWPSEATSTSVNKHGEVEVAGQCRRNTFLRYTVSQYAFDKVKYAHYRPLVEELHSVEQEPDRYMRWIWKAGEMFEEYVIDLAKESGVYLASQVQVVIPEYNVVGKLDLIVSNPVTGRPIAEEIKSIYGHGAIKILGTPSMQSKRKLGSPRSSNMMQIGIYDWHLKKKMSDLEVSRLFYGARDTGRYAEFDITTEFDGTATHIAYQGVSPYLDGKVITPITIENIMENYKFIHDSFIGNEIPDRDYDMQYSHEKLLKIYNRGEMSKTNAEAFEKILARKEENDQRLLDAKPAKKELKPLEMGDWMCGNCTWRNYCYDPDTGKPRRDRSKTV